MPPLGSFPPRTAPSTGQPNSGEMLADRVLHCCSPEEGAQCEPCVESTAFWAGFPPQCDYLPEILVLPKSLGEPPLQPSDLETRAEVSTGCGHRTCPSSGRAPSGSPWCLSASFPVSYSCQIPPPSREPYFPSFSPSSVIPSRTAVASLSDLRAHQ